jgi:hypothetical protein
MEGKSKKLNIIQYSKSMDKNLRIINKNKNLKDLLQEMNNINNNIIRYQQIENLIKYTETKGFGNKSNENKNQEKIGLLEDMKLLQNRLYKTKKTPTNGNNIKIHKNNFKDVMEDIFGKSDAQQKRRYYPRLKTKLKNIKNLNDVNMNYSEKIIKKENIGNQTSNKNICVTERNINDYKSKKKIIRSNTLENEKNQKNTNYNYMNYASNCVKYKHPQFYLLNLSNINKKHLPPIKTKQLKVVDLFNKNNTSFKSNDKKRNKFEKYLIALQMAGIAKFKVNE